MLHHDFLVSSGSGLGFRGLPTFFLSFLFSDRATNEFYCTWTSWMHGLLLFGVYAGVISNKLWWYPQQQWPYDAMFDYMGAFLFRSGFAHADNVITKRCSKTITWLFLSRLQGNKPLLNFPKPWNSPPAQTGTLRNLRNLPPEPTPAHIGILWNLPEPASGTYTTTHRDFPRNLHQHTPEPSGTFRQPASGNYTSTPEPSGTFRNLPPEPTPAHTGTLRNLPEPSGTFLRNLLLRPAPAHTLKTPLAYAVGEKNLRKNPSLCKPLGGALAQDLAFINERTFSLAVKSP